MQALVNLPAVDFHEALDFTLAYCVWCHSLRDWLIKDGAIPRERLDDHLKEYPEWKIVRDLANRSRHLVLTQRPTDADWAVFREYDPFASQLGGSERQDVVLLFGDSKYRMTDIVSRSGRMWERVLSAESLLQASTEN